jgi:hypothetical protein
MRRVEIIVMVESTASLTRQATCAYSRIGRISRLEKRVRDSTHHPGSRTDLTAARRISSWQKRSQTDSIVARRISS